MTTDERPVPDPLVQELAAIRKKAGITQKVMAAAIRSNQSHVSDVETGKVDPTLRTLCRYAKVLGVRLSLGVDIPEEFRE